MNKLLILPLLLLLIIPIGLSQNFNLSNVSESSNPMIALVSFANTATDGWAGKLVLIGVFTVLFVAFSFFDTSDAFAAASYVTALIAIFGRILGLVRDDLTVFVAVILACIAFVLMLAKKGGGT